MRRPKTRLFTVAAALAATLALTGCVKLDEDLTINSDNTIDGTVTVAFNKSMLEMVGATAEDALGDTSGVPEGDHVSVEPYEDDTFVGQTYTLDRAPLNELNTSSGDGDLQIVRDGDNFHVTGTLDFSDSTLAGDGSVPADGFAVRIALTFPGEIVSSTGQIDGNTVTWTPEMGDVVDFETIARAEGGAAAGAGRFTLVGLGLAIVAAVGATVLVFQQRRKMPAPAGPGATTADPWTATAPREPGATTAGPGT
ncbi:MAG: hypothetical protein OEW29_14075, partial [Acidimicrobiia bacterium]|nr:hypothetical protein [Acidimicrobiia bacterium]